MAGQIKLMGQEALLCANEVWYCVLRYGQYAGYLSGALLLRAKRPSYGLPVLTASALWQYLLRTESRRMRLVPNIRTLCQAAAKRALEAHAQPAQPAQCSTGCINVMDGFSQAVSRFLFQPQENYGEDGEVIVVETMLTDGSRESKSNFKKNKGIFGFTHAQDLNAGVEPKEPCSFQRDDGTTAVVRMWCVNVPGLEKAFDMVEVKAVSDLKAFAEQVAYNDFQQALSKLLGPERVAQGRILKCTQRQAMVNDFLALEGSLNDVVEVLQRHPLITRHYFRLFLSEEEGRVAFHANLGFGQKCLDLFPGSRSSRCVLYTRQGGQIHACTQGLPEFVLDRRMITTSEERSAPVIDTSSSSGFGKILLLQHLGGAVYTTSAQEGPRAGQQYAVKLTSLRINERCVDREKQILQGLQHPSFLQVHDCFEVLPKWYGADMDRVFGKKGVVMDVNDTSLQSFLETKPKPLDPSWLQECRPLMSQMASAVQYMHGRGVMHGNLKPGNVLLRTKGTKGTGLDVVISDFSCAVDGMVPGKLLSHPRGALAYQAPQMHAQPPEPYSLKADVYSLGRTFQALLQRSEMRGNEETNLETIEPLEVRQLLGKMQAHAEVDRPSTVPNGGEVLLAHRFFADFSWGSCRFTAVKASNSGL